MFLFNKQSTKHLALGLLIFLISSILTKFANRILSFPKLGHLMDDGQLLLDQAESDTKENIWPNQQDIQDNVFEQDPQEIQGGIKFWIMFAWLNTV